MSNYSGCFRNKKNQAVIHIHDGLIVYIERYVLLGAYILGVGITLYTTISFYQPPLVVGLT